jgi:hypothetical protein
MRGRTAAIIITIIFAAYTSHSEPASASSLVDRLWAEIWTDTSYRSTNFGSDAKESKEEDFVITYLSGSAGVRFPLTEGISLDPYFKLDLVRDWCGNEWNDVYWNNNLDWGFGARAVYDYAAKTGNGGFFRVNSLSIHLFAEYLLIEDSLDGSKDKLPDGIHGSNVRSGVGSWLSIDTRPFLFDTMALWGEMWSEFAYENTGFSDREHGNFFILRLSPTIGLKLDVLKELSIQPYYALSLTSDFGNEEWNREPWLNGLEYGPGLRLSLGGFLPIEQLSLHLRAELLHSHYFGRVDEEKYAAQADRDFRVGLNIWLPLGATKGRLSRN